MNRRLMISLTAVLLSSCSFLLLLLLCTFFFTLSNESPTIKPADLFPDGARAILPDTSLSPSKVAVSGITLSAEIEQEPFFIAPNWREALPTASKIPTIMLVVSTSPTIKTHSIIVPSITPSITKTDHTSTTPSVVATIPPPLKSSPTKIESALTPTEEAMIVSPSSTPSATPLPEPSVTEANMLPLSSPSASATATLVSATATSVPSASPTTIPTALPATLSPPSEAVPQVPSISDLTYQAMFQHVGAEYDMNWRLLASVAYSESSLNPTAVGKDGEQGLMQILPSTWDEFAPRVGVSDPFDPVSNVQVGTAYLAYLRERLIKKGYPEEYWALVAYNWGPNNLARLLEDDGNWGGIPIIRQDYAYQIIAQITESKNEWLEKKLQERVY